MSRIGKKPIPIPAGVEVGSHDRIVTGKGPKGALSLEIRGGVEVSVEAGEKGVREVVVRRTGKARRDREKHGLYRALIAGMIRGVTEGYHKELDIQGVGYRATKEGDVLSLQLGFADRKRFTIPEGIDVQLPGPQRIMVAGIDKQLVGEFAAAVRAARIPDPYKNKGVRYVNETVRKLAGKTFTSTGRE